MVLGQLNVSLALTKICHLHGYHCLLSACQSPFADSNRRKKAYVLLFDMRDLRVKVSHAALLYIHMMGAYESSFLPFFVRRWMSCLIC